MMSYITAFDRVKYTRMLPVYLPGMIQMNDESPKISWFLLRGTFSFQKTLVHGAAKGNDHPREQKQIQGGLIGILEN